MAHKELAPGGGKGSADRTTDVRRFQSEFDRIFGSKKTKPNNDGKDGQK